MSRGNSQFSRAGIAALALLLAVGFAGLAFGQAVTTGTLSGTVTASADGSLLPGVTIEALYTPTGTRYSGITQENGRYRLSNVRAGGPYTLTVTLDGFRTAEMTEITVALGEDRTVDVAMEPEAVAETITVTAEAPLIEKTQGGTVANVSHAQVEAIPTIDRSLEDLAKTNVYFSTSGGVQGGAEETTFSVAGRNNRYNTIQIDGAVNNDVFGLSPSGSPNGQADAQPISMEVVQEVQLLVSPYDVRQGGFSGGGINAITKSGTNAFHGALYYQSRDESLVGDGPANRPFGTFEETIYGAAVGGPIMKDRLFFFFNADYRRKDIPTGFSAESIGREAEISQIRSILQTKYGYDPGSTAEFTKGVNADNYFLRFDLNAGPANQAILRHNQVDSVADVIFPSSTFYPMGDYAYNIRPKTDSTVAQLNSIFGADYFNEARIGFTKVRTVRDGPTRFPAIEVDLPGGVSVDAGRERFSTANELDQDIFELTDDLTLTRGNHTLTVGTHNEFMKFRNLFIRDAYGRYNFASIADLQAGLANEYDYSFSKTGDPRQDTEFDVRQYGVYGGDQFRLADTATLTFGMRADYLSLPDSPSFNPDVLATYGYSTSKVPDSTYTLSPRIGVNWDPTGKGKMQVRGGVGIFYGRTPYVWISNQYGNTGMEFQRLSFRQAGIVFNPNPDTQPTSLGSVQTNEINITDPDFKMPTLLRGNLAYDFELPGSIVASVEGTYGKVRDDILYQNLNITPTGRTVLGGRPEYKTVSTKYSSVIFLTNTNEGRQYTAAVQLRQREHRGFSWNAGYIYQDATEVNPGTSSQASSNWLNTSAIDPNDPGTHPSTFTSKHRFTGTTTYRFNMGPVRSTVSLFFNRTSGRPYSTTYTSTADVNGDSIRGNDLLYVPASADEVIVQGGTWDQLNAYIERDPSLRKNRGRIVPANEGSSPWSSKLDLHWGIDFPITVVRLGLTVDVLNLYNLIDSDKGVQKYTAFGEISPVTFGGYDTATGKPIYRLSSFVTRGERGFNVDDVRSRWQAKLGVRLSF